MRGPVVITGGGTGGHIFPMKAIADVLVDQGLDPRRVRYVGSRRGQESTLLADGRALTLLPGRGIKRSWGPRAVVDNVGALVGLGVSVVVALFRVGCWRPAVVVSLGGYASLAVSFAAVVWRRPLVLVELDAAPGAAQRVVTRFAARRCSAFDDGDARTVVTGVPLRREITGLDRSSTACAERRDTYDPPIERSRVVIVVMTGSLGARSVNRAVSELARLWSDRADLALIHVTGRRDYAEMKARASAATALDYRIEAFAQMGELWGLADVAVCRAGATTIAELTALGIASVLVPLPNAPGDHQRANAERVVTVGGALLLADQECSARALADALTIVFEPSTRERMALAAKSLGRIDAAASIARVVREAGELG